MQRLRPDVAMHPARSPLMPAFVLLYGLMYAAFGVASPFWPLFFESRGLSPEQIGILLAVGVLPRLLAGPLIGRIADMLGALRATLAVCLAVSAVAALALLPAHGFLALLVIVLFQAAALAPVTTLADALAVNAPSRTSGRRAFEYGWARGTGSGAFVVGTLIAGQVLTFNVMQLSAVAWLHAGLLSCAIVTAALVPSLAAGKIDQSQAQVGLRGDWRELLHNQPFRFAILTSSVVFGSHAMHDAFAVIRWNSAGIDAATVSLLWSEAVAAEVLVFFYLGPLIIRSIGPKGAATLAAIAGIVRWLVMSYTTDLTSIALVQPLHGFTFALLHLACMRVIGLSAPVRLAATAQAIYAFGAAVTSALLTYLSGVLYGQFGARGFLAMALLCVLALPFAMRLPSRHILAAARQQDAPARS